MKILIINPPMQVNIEPEAPPLGIAYVAAELRKNGYGAEILDIDTNRFNREEVSSRIASSDADIIGIGGLVTVYPYLDWLIPEIRKVKPGTPIILGGAVASSLGEKVFSRFDIDYAVIGEGEVTAVELLREISAGGKNLGTVKGIGYRDQASMGKAIFTEKRELMLSLDLVPIFNDAEFPMERLLKNTGGAIQIHVQRGCPSSCTFCFNCYRVVSSRVRYRPVKNVADEIEYLRDKYGKKVSLFVISGECVAMNKEWLISLCKEIINRKLNIKYRVNSRVDTLDDERLDWLKRSGCSVLSLGLESGSQKILKIMNKRATVEQGRRAVELAKKYIPVLEIAIMLGYVGEDHSTLAETVKFCKDLGSRPSFFYATPFPGTVLYRMALEMGRIRDEETYLMGLDKALIFNYSVNLTDMPDREAVEAIRRSVNQVELHYILKDAGNLSLIRHFFNRMRKEGVINTVKNVTKRLEELFVH